MSRLQAVRGGGFIAAGNKGDIRITILDWGGLGTETWARVAIFHPSFASHCHEDLLLDNGDWRHVGHGVSLRLVPQSQDDTEHVFFCFKGGRGAVPATAEQLRDSARGTRTERDRPPHRRRAGQGGRQRYSPKEQPGLKSKWAQGGDAN